MPISIDQFKQQAIQAGINPAEVDKYLQSYYKQQSLPVQAQSDQLGLQQQQLAIQKAQQGLAPDPEQQLAADASTGMGSGLDTSQPLVPQLFAKYGSKISDPNRILQLYNQTSKYGPATESGDQLAQYGVDTSKFEPKDKSTTNNQKAQAGIKVSGQIDSVPQDIKDKTGGSEAFSTTFKLGLPVIGRALIRGKTETQLADLESKYFLMVQSALTAIQGSRPSDYDVKSYMDKAGPSIKNSPQVNKDRMYNLLKLMQGVSGEKPTSQPNTTNAGFDYSKFGL